MISQCTGSGLHPFVVNVIAYSGHGITFDGDAIAAIPESPGTNKAGDQKFLRFINFSD